MNLVVKYLRVLLVILILLLLTTIAAMYGVGWENPYTVAVARIVRLPLGTINGRVVGIDRFYDELFSLYRVQSSGQLTVDDPRRAVLDSIIRAYALEALAKDYDVVVKRSDIDEYYQRIGLDASKSETALLIKNEYGLSLDSFTDYIVKPEVLKIKISKYLLLNTPVSALKKAQETQSKLLEDPKKFDTIDYDDATSGGGPIIKSDVLLTEANLEGSFKPLKNLETEMISPLIVTPEGFYIYKLLAVFDTPTKAWQYSQLFIPYDHMAGILKEAQDKARATIYASKLISKK